MEILLLLLLPLLAIIPANIARAKGRSFWKWYVYGLLLFAIAMIHAMLIDENHQGINKNEEEINLDVLLKYKELLEEGLITREEFENKKRNLIGDNL